MFPRGVQVEGVDRAGFRRVPVDARCGDKRGDCDFTGASVCYVEGALIRGEGDAVGLLEGVFHERWLACLRVEAEGSGSHLRRLGVDGIAAAVVFFQFQSDFEYSKAFSRREIYLPLLVHQIWPFASMSMSSTELK